MTSATHRDPRHAIVTGGATGLGLACSKRLLANGFRVFALGMDVEEEIDHPLYAFQHFDVTDAAAVAQLGQSHLELDALVNAAGIILHDDQEFTNEGFRKVIEVNLLAAQNLAFTLHDALKARRGAIVNFASMWSIFGSARNPGYSASKGAVLQLTRSLAASWGSSGIRSNAVAPGWIKTRMSLRAMSDPERAGPILRRIPMGDWGEPDDVAAAVAFLVSEDARYINGVLLPIDGGYSIA